ncbi:Deleted in malignant brain tumors 1 protein, partial [Exaiptasia diaphana]
MPPSCSFVRTLKNLLLLFKEEGLKLRSVVLTWQIVEQCLHKIIIIFLQIFFSCLSISSAFISCGSDIYLQAGTFSVNLVSPGHPSYYPSGTCKKWRITAPSGKLVQLKFISFDLYGYPTCSKSSDDTLKIYDSFSSSNLIG